jgi:hypothetical protein
LEFAGCFALRTTIGNATVAVGERGPPKVISPLPRAKPPLRLSLWTQVWRVVFMIMASSGARRSGSAFPER